MTEHSEVKRFAVTGGRHYEGWDAVLAALLEMPRTAVLVHGAATGADRIAAHLWTNMGHRTEAYPANWNRYGKAAGVIRNQEMVDSGIDLLLAFPGGRGTADMCWRCEGAGIPVVRCGQ